MRTLGLKPGRWCDVNRGQVIDGGSTIQRAYMLNEVPLFARAGAAVPMNPPSVQKLQDPEDGRLVLRVYPGGKLQTRHYTDAGNSEGYRGSDYAFTAIETVPDARQATVTVVGATARTLACLDPADHRGIARRRLSGARDGERHSLYARRRRPGGELEL